jgi:hypothetical protein
MVEERRLREEAVLFIEIGGVSPGDQVAAEGKARIPPRSE